MDNRTPPITGTTTPTPAQPAAPFDPDTLPPHLRATLDRISDIRMRMLEVIERDEARAAEVAAAAAEQAQAARTKEKTNEPTNTAR